MVHLCNIMKWISNSQFEISLGAFSSLLIAVIPNNVMADMVLLQEQTSGISIARDIIQIIAGVVAIILSMMLICVNARRFRSFIRAIFKRSSNGGKA